MKVKLSLILVIVITFLLYGVHFEIYQINRDEHELITAYITFLIIGVQKAGTTSLFQMLSTVPEISTPIIALKEVHQFDHEEKDDYDFYHQFFNLTDGKKIRGEATPSYIFVNGALERIKHYNPRVKLIVSLRDPVDRAFSHWQMEVRRGRDQANFSWAIREGRKRMHAGASFVDNSTFSYVERGFYAEQLMHLYSLFPQEQILLIHLDDLHLEPLSTLQKVCSFIGVKAVPTAVDSWHLNRSPSKVHMSEEDRSYLESLYRQHNKDLLALVARNKQFWKKHCLGSACAQRFLAIRL